MLLTVADSLSIPRFTKHSWIAFSALRGAYKHVQVSQCSTWIQIHLQLCINFITILMHSWKKKERSFYLKTCLRSAFRAIIFIFKRLMELILCIFRLYFRFHSSISISFAQFYIEFKPESSNGIILLTGERDDLSGDFLAVLIDQGHIEFWWV